MGSYKPPFLAGYLLVSSKCYGIIRSLKQLYYYIAVHVVDINIY